MSIFNEIRLYVTDKLLKFNRVVDGLILLLFEYSKITAKFFIKNSAFLEAKCTNKCFCASQFSITGSNQVFITFTTILIVSLVYATT